MLLSIGMIIKNEEKRLRNCLDSLRPILEQMDSELIIYDTGSNDASVEIAKEYTDRVFEIPWRGDFSWARNHTIDEARGKWFFFIDADNVLKNPSHIIDFFNSGEYTKYRHARISIIELDIEGKPVGNTVLPRFWRLGKGVRFSGKIHEAIPPFPPYKILESEITHTGYAYGSEADREAKRKRNMVPMLEEYEKNPEGIRNIYHICNELLDGDRAEFKKWLDIGLALYEKNSENAFIHGIYYLSFAYYIKAGDYEGMIDAINQYFATTPVLFANAPNISFTHVEALVKLERYKEAAEAGIKTLELFDLQQKGELNEDIRTVVILRELPVKDRAEIILLICANFVKAAEFDLAAKWAAELTDTKVDIFGNYAEHSLSLGHHGDLCKIFAYAAQKYAPGHTEYENAIHAIESRLPSAVAKMAFVNAFLNDPEINGDSDYARLQRLRKHYFDGMGAAMDEELEYFLGVDAPFSQHYGDVLVAAMDGGANFANFLENMQITDTKGFVAAIVRTNQELVEILCDYLQGAQDAPRPIKIARLLSSLAMGVFDQARTDNLNKDEAAELRIFEAAMRLNHSYLAAIYKEEIYCDAAASALSERDAFAYFVGIAYAHKDAGDLAGYVQNLRAALKVNPNMKDIIAALVAQVKEEEAARPLSVHEQLAQEIAALKSVIHTMLSTGNAAKAAEILESYAAINPDDPDIDELARQIEQIS